MPRRTPFKYVIEDKSRHGDWRVYYRAPGRKKVRIWVSKEHPQFYLYYDAAVRGVPLPKPQDRAPAEAPALRGTFAGLVDAYSKSAQFLKLTPLSQRTRIAILRQCCVEKTGSGQPYGGIPLKFFTSAHVKALRDLKAGLPGAANNRVKYLKSMFGWHCEGDDNARNPTKGIKMLGAVRKHGFHAWTLAEVHQYMERHPTGTKARLALDIALYTTARRSDVVKLGPRHLDEDGWLTFNQTKTGDGVTMPMIDPLLESIQACGAMAGPTFLTTEGGEPYSVEGFGNRFREWCDQAGLPHCSAHGVRKATTARLAELGCTDEEIQAITGHRTKKEVSVYTRSARRKILAASAMAKFGAGFERAPGLPLIEGAV